MPVSASNSDRGYCRQLSRLAAAFCCAASGAAYAADPPLAFMGAEGAGRFAAGGRGGVILHVITLADGGPGSLRAAIAAEGARIVVFDVAGTIHLTSPLEIRHANITIAGQTAPGGGITIADQSLIVKADDVVVRFIRSRFGDRAKIEGDAIWIASGHRIILDHVSASWSTDETLSVSARYAKPGDGVFDVTVQWSIIAQSLRQSVHSKGSHGYGSLVRGGAGARFSFHHNLWAHHMARMPRPGNYAAIAEDPVGPLIEFRSNVFYNWGGSASGYDADANSAVAYNFIDNVYIAGPDSKKLLAFNEQNAAARSWFAGNSMSGVIPADPWSLVRYEGVTPNRLTAAIDVAPVVPEAVDKAGSRILDGAGASLARDRVDAAVVTSVRARTGGIIDSQEEIGGWPELDPGAPLADRDHDGMADAWENTHGTNPGIDDANRTTKGRSNIERYLDDRAAGWSAAR